MKQWLGAEAIVVGGSIAGLRSARVLADHFDRVTIVERDEPNLGRPEARKGAPQGLHYHVILKAGLDLLTDLFPGFRERLNALGSRATRAVTAVAYHQADGIAFSPSGSLKVARDLGYDVQCQSRPLLEFCIRQYALEVPNIRWMSGVTAQGLVHEGGRVRGLRVGSVGGETELLADLVVDAGGRAARTPRWLKELGYAAPEESRAHCDIAYTTTKFRVPAKYLDWPYNLNVFYPPIPQDKTACMMHRIENDTWHVTLMGRLGDHPPRDEAGFYEFARNFYTPQLYDMIKDAERIADITPNHFHYGVLRHYERLTSFPEALLPIGDAICSVNPVHGQGMSGSALQVRVLRKLLQARAAAGTGLEGLATQFFPQAAEAVQQPWMLAAMIDLQFPETPDERPPGFEQMLQYVGAIDALLPEDEELHRLYGEVMQLTAPISVLWEEGVQAKVAAYLACVQKRADAA